MAVQPSLPEYQFGDERFVVDLRKWQFRQVDDPANTISLNRLKEAGKQSLLHYDKRTKNAFQGGVRAFKNAGDKVLIVPLPSLGALDPVGAHAIITEHLTRIRKARSILNKKSVGKQHKNKKR